MVEIVLVRHAATAWSGIRYCGTSDPRLSPDGVAQADRLARALAPRLTPATRIVTSPSQRAIATASAIAHAAVSARVEVDERWREADLGLAEGRTFEEVAAIAPTLAEQLAAGTLTIDWPGGETHAALAARVETAWRELVADDRPAVVVTHAGPLMHARAIATGRPVRADDHVEPGVAVSVTMAGGGLPVTTVLPSRP